ncbi:hypothetical protein EG339_06590 [Chryseobacterium bernardetii]|uniref:Uncharacterized protein n=1 Tax=Chryseobacterium bernardetii TaxID=1241978 RepID=A0A3G6T8P6_9FLAO|nr:hypothetical protein [Chryseobacterium bernardetii]AZB24299.1 hypothetical protein EG339_06590 [Chryseobacterium bernardetii]
METKIADIQLIQFPESVQKQRKATHGVVVNTENFDAKTQKLLISVNNKVYEADPVTKEIEIILKEPPKSDLQNTIFSSDTYRVKAHIIDSKTEKILGSKLQEFKTEVQNFQHQKYDELLSTSNVVLGDYKSILEKWRQELSTKDMDMSHPEPWKEFDVYSQYIGYLCYGINAKANNNSNTFLTGFTAAIKYEAYNIGNGSKEGFHNWMYLLNVWMDNRGELVDARMDLFAYRCNLQSGPEREILRGNTGKGKSSVSQSSWGSVSKGKKLHDEIFLQKKLILLDNIRDMDFEANSSLKDFYNRTASILREASIFNRTSDISYSFALANKEDDNLLSTIAGKSAAHDYPFLTEIIKNKQFGVFKEIQGIFGYIFDDVLGAVSFSKKLFNYRGPFLLGSIAVEKNNAGAIHSFQDDNPDAILYDLQLLNKTNLKP